MKEKMPKNWNYGTISIIILCFFTIVIFIFNNKNLINIYKHTTYSVDEKDRLDVGTPKYIDYKDTIANNNMYNENEDVKYSEIEVKNISNEALYDIVIVLKEQKSKVKSQPIIPSYNIVSLEPGEIAKLSTQHSGVNEGSKLMVDYYYYKDGKGINYRVEKSSIKSNSKEGIYIEKDNEFYKYSDINKDVNKISIEKINMQQKEDTKIYNVTIKNMSNTNLDRVHLIFKQYHNGIVIGDINYPLEKGLDYNEEARIKIKSQENVKIQLEGYSYTINYNENNDKEYTDYLINIKQGNYYEFKYEDSEAKLIKNKIIIISNIFMIVILILLNKYSDQLEEKGNFQIDGDKIKCAKYIRVIRSILFVLYIMFLIYFYI